MKTKNVVLGIAALFCAAGSALASFSMVLPHYVNVKYAATQVWSCVTLAACTVAGNTPCSAVIDGVTPLGAPTTYNAPVYDTKPNATTCSIRIRSAFATVTVPENIPTIDAVR